MELVEVNFSGVKIADEVRFVVQMEHFVAIEGIAVADHFDN